MPDPQGSTPASLAYRVTDLTRRVEGLEHEKLGQGVALIQLEQKHQGTQLSDLKRALSRLEDVLKLVAESSAASTASRAGSERSWKAVWTYVVGGLVALTAIAGPLISIILRG